ELPLPAASPHLPSAHAFHDAYRSGATDPVAVTERVFAEARRLASATPSMECLCAIDEAGALRDARASAVRWADGEPLSALDGVPVPIKEEVDLEGIGYRLGTRFVPGATDAHDATVVRLLRAAGAIIVGHTPMTEMGMSPLGGNVHR